MYGRTLINRVRKITSRMIGDGEGRFRHGGGGANKVFASRQLLKRHVQHTQYNLVHVCILRQTLTIPTHCPIFKRHALHFPTHFITHTPTILIISSVNLSNPAFFLFGITFLILASLSVLHPHTLS